MCSDENKTEEQVKQAELEKAKKKKKEFDPFDVTDGDAEFNAEDIDIEISSSAEPPEPVKPEVIHTSSVFVAPEYEHAVDKLLAQIINLNEDSILHEPTCIICKSPYRSDFEQKWAETKDYVEVRKLMKERTGIKRVPKSVIQNHITFHANQDVRELQKVEYVNRIKRLNSFNLSTLERIRLGMSAITERLMGVNSIVPDSETSIAEIEKIKTTETARLMSSMNQMLKLQAEILGEMKNSGELITIPRDDFIRIFNDAILGSESDLERDTIKNILNQLAVINKVS